MVLMLARTALVRSKRISAGGGAVPTFFGAGTASNDTGGSASVTPDYPASVAADDIAIIIHALYDSAGSGATTLSTPDGWTAFGAQVHDGSNYIIARAYWKRLAGSESGSVTVSHTLGMTQAYARMGVFRGCATVGDPFEDYDTSGGSASSFTSPTTTTLGANRLGLRLSVVLSGLAESPPSGWTERYETAATSLTVAGDTKTIASASTEAASARTEGFSTNYVVLALALKPT